MNEQSPGAPLLAGLSFKGMLLLVVALVPVLIASMAGQLFTAPALAPWYEGLKKPFFNPPNVVFPLVWTFLYALMAVSLWRILRVKAEAGAKGPALWLFALQLTLNVGWSWAFFGQRSPALGLVVIGALALSIAATIRAFSRIDRAAGSALWLYLAWVLFAALLNAAIMILN